MATRGLRFASVAGSAPDVGVRRRCGFGAGHGGSFVAARCGFGAGRGGPVLVVSSEVVGDAIEDAVHERAALFRPEAFGDFDRLVERDRARDVAPLAELPHPEPEHVAVDARHALEAPIRARLDDALVDAREPRVDAAHRLVRVRAVLGVARKLAPKLRDGALHVRAARVDREQHLKRGFAGGRTGSHGRRTGYHGSGGRHQPTPFSSSHRSRARSAAPPRALRAALHPQSRACGPRLFRRKKPTNVGKPRTPRRDVNSGEVSPSISTTLSFPAAPGSAATSGAATLQGRHHSVETSMKTGSSDCHDGVVEIELVDPLECMGMGCIRHGCSGRSSIRGAPRRAVIPAKCYEPATIVPARGRAPRAGACAERLRRVRTAPGEMPRRSATSGAVMSSTSARSTRCRSSGASSKSTRSRIAPTPCRSAAVFGRFALAGHGELGIVAALDRSSRPRLRLAHADATSLTSQPSRLPSPRKVSRFSVAMSSASWTASSASSCVLQ